jgi:hypothetical protein
MPVLRRVAPYEQKSTITTPPRRAPGVCAALFSLAVIPSERSDEGSASSFGRVAQTCAVRKGECDVLTVDSGPRSPD